MLGQTQKHPEWRIVVDMFRESQYGDVLTHDVLCAATGLRPETMSYYRQVSKARRVLLRDHDIEVETEAKVGYRRVEPHRYGERARRDVRLGNRRIKRGRRVLQAAPVHLLNGDQVREIEHAMVKMNLLAQQMSSTIKSMRNVLPPVQTPPQLTDGNATHA